MAIGDFYQLTIRCCNNGQEFTMGQAYKMTQGAADGDTLREACEEFITDIEPSLLNILADNVFVDQISLEPFGGVDEVGGFVNNSNTAGQVAANGLPTNVAMVMSQLTDAPAAKCNGRMFIAGVPDTVLVNQQFTGAYVLLGDVFGTAMEGSLEPAGTTPATFVPVIISRVLDGVPRDPFVAFNILSNSCGADPRQQRRRTTKRYGIAVAP